MEYMHDSINSVYSIVGTINLLLTSLQAVKYAG